MDFINKLFRSPQLFKAKCCLFRVKNMIQIPVDKIIQALGSVSLMREMGMIIRTTKHVYVCACVYV